VFDQFLGAVALAICLVLLVRLMLGPRRQQRFDAAARRTWSGCRRAVRRAVRWPSARRDAAAAAEDAIRRARGANGRGGKVIRPRSFRGPRKPH